MAIEPAGPRNGRRARAAPFAGASGSTRLVVLFGALYFLQSIIEPTEGLIAQPTRSHLRSLGRSEGQIATFVALIALPWSWKPLFGLLSDFVPLAGMRRKGYLIVASAVTVAGFLFVSSFDPGADRLLWLFTGLTITTSAVAFSDVVVDAMMVEQGQALGLTGRLQGVQWASMYMATVVTGSLGGLLSAKHQLRRGYLFCGGIAIVTLGLSVLAVKEPPSLVPKGEGWPKLREIQRVYSAVPILSLGCFLFLFNFNPVSGTIIHLYMTGPMQLGERFFGNTLSLLALASVMASLGYSIYCRWIAMKALVHVSIVLGILSTLAYWALVDRMSAALVSLFVGSSYMTATLIQLDLAARACPPRMAGTTFSLLMAISNLGTVLSAWAGGVCYERLKALWGSSVAFDLLVGVGALFTAGCWVLVPFLPLGESRRGGAGLPVESSAQP